VFGRGSQAGIKFVTRAGDIIVDELEKTKIETVVDDEIVDKAIDAIVSAAQTGKPGDGRLIVTPVERFVRIRQDSESPKE
jgi:nitrogen regulatory protein P-II 1